MLTTAVRRGMLLYLFCLAVAGCDRRPEAAGTGGADAPAVVKLPPLVLESDTARRDTLAAHAEKMNMTRTTLATNYAVLGTAISLGDRRMIASMYAPDATLATPDSSYMGLTAIASVLAALGPSKSLRTFDRLSLAFSIVDSTVTDSGTYVAVSGRQGADSVVERGTYVSTWRMHAPPAYWSLTSDRLLRAAKKPKGR